MMYVPKARKDSTMATTRTQAQRSMIIRKTRENAAGQGDGVKKQLTRELSRMSKPDLQSLGVMPNVPPGAGLMLKTSLSLPWNRLRTLRR